MKIEFLVVQGFLSPCNLEGREAIRKWGSGNLIIGEFVKPRNNQFLKKFFAMLDVGYEAWETPDGVGYKGMKIEKNRERFRKDCIILAGYFHLVYDINGEEKAVADSISFAEMDEMKFEELYSKVIDVLLGKVMRNYTRKDIDDHVDRILGFA